MNARNFDKMMQEELKNAKGKSILLHCCCAPCSSACLERLKDDLRITALFYNPNIEDPEYTRRKQELIRLIKITGWADILDCDSDARDFYEAVKGHEADKEGGERCRICFRLRLERTAKLADGGKFDYFSSTLTISPLKDAAVINETGESVQGAAKWLYSDFKKRGGYLESVKLSKEYCLYRQDYCGCVFSRRKTVDKD